MWVFIVKIPLIYEHVFYKSFVKWELEYNNIIEQRKYRKDKIDKNKDWEREYESWLFKLLVKFN